MLVEQLAVIITILFVFDPISSPIGEAMNRLSKTDMILVKL